MTTYKKETPVHGFWTEDGWGRTCVYLGSIHDLTSIMPEEATRGRKGTFVFTVQFTPDDKETAK